MTDLKFPLEEPFQGRELSVPLTLILSLLVCFTAANYLYHGVFRPLFTQKADFEAYYNAALAFRYRLPLYQFMVDFFEAGPYYYQGPLPYVYPPFFAVLLSPLGYLSFHQAALIWFILNQALFVAGGVLTLKSISPSCSRSEALLTAFAFMNFTPLFIDLLLGQSNIILFFLIVTGLYMLRTG
ncbi:MAG: glycosyltransferase family 87 protein, partial [candidate division WOR-3 bacterium]